MRHITPLILTLTLAPAAAHAQPSQGEDEIVVTAERPRGSVPFDVAPETTYNAADVRSYGATSIFQLLAAVSPQTGSASIRGAGMPIVLINGRRISGMQEVRDLPPDVVSRVEVFDEQLALLYGYSADQRVVNLVLENEFRASSVEGGGGNAADGARASRRIEGANTSIDGGNRFALGAALEDADEITELERDIGAPTAGADARTARTLAPDTQSWRANVSLGRALSERLTANVSLRAESSEDQSLLGFDALGALRVRNAETDTVRLATGLDGAVGGWLWTATATADRTNQDSRTIDALAPSSASSDSSLLDVTANANGAVFDLPGGRARLSLRAGVEDRQIESTSTSVSSSASASLNRTTPSARVTFVTPITSRRREFGEAFGDISINTTASWSSPSDTSSLSSYGAGGSWSPTRALRLTLQSESSEAAPSLQQLGDPLLITPDVTYFDPVRGENVLITRTTGGNAALLTEEREDLTLNANYSVSQALSLSFSWARNESSNVSAALPANLLETEGAFPARFVRDGAGVLTAVDARAVNIAQRDIETIRWGLSFQAPIGQSRTPETAIDAAVGVERGEGQPQRRGLGAANAGRFNISVFHRIRLMDEIALAPGQPTIDLSDRGGLDGAGEPANSIEFEGGVFYRGMGLRLNGGWTDGYTTPVATGGALEYSDRFRIGLRSFINFDARPQILDAAPFLEGARLALSIENLTDSYVEVKDESGAVPAAYQEGYRNPLGRVIQLSFRKQW